MEPMYYIDPAPSALCLLNRRRFESADVALTTARIF